MNRAIAVFIFALAAASASCANAANRVVVASKVFTESVLLEHVAADLLAGNGIAVEHREQLGGTRVLWQALLAGQIDVYPEYTGTILQEILPAGTNARSEDDLRSELMKHGIGMTHSLGFNDTYAIGMRDEQASTLGVVSLTDLQKHPDLKLGFSNEFLNRKDGWPMVRGRYGLTQGNVTGLDHDLAYRALSSAAIDLTDLYSTDAEIAFYHLRVLVDDRHVFPEYQAVYLYRLDLQRISGAVKSLEMAEGKIDATAMIGMNKSAKLDKISEATVAANFVRATFGSTVAVTGESFWARLWRRTVEHLGLVAASLSAAVVVSIPLGVAAAKLPRAGHLIIGTVSALYTIPSLALLVFMIPLLGIGSRPAIVALFLYSLLPIVRNTQAGLHGIPKSIRESAEALGLSSWARLMRVELPLASPSILAGIKTSAVINVGTATLGALIGAGGYGQPILTGIRLADTGLILQGAIPAAVLALLVQGVFDLLERVVVPRGLRLPVASV